MVYTIVNSKLLGAEKEVLGVTEDFQGKCQYEYQLNQINVTSLYLKTTAVKNLFIRNT